MLTGMTGFLFKAYQNKFQRLRHCSSAETADWISRYLLLSHQALRKPLSGIFLMAIAVSSYKAPPLWPVSCPCDAISLMPPAILHFVVFVNVLGRVCHNDSRAKTDNRTTFSPLVADSAHIANCCLLTELEFLFRFDWISRGGLRCLFSEFLRHESLSDLCSPAAFLFHRSQNSRDLFHRQPRDPENTGKGCE